MMLAKFFMVYQATGGTEQLLISDSPKSTTGVSVSVDELKQQNLGVMNLSFKHSPESSNIWSIKGNLRVKVDKSNLLDKVEVQKRKNKFPHCQIIKMRNWMNKFVPIIVSSRR